MIPAAGCTWVVIGHLYLKEEPSAIMPWWNRIAQKWHAAVFKHKPVDIKLREAFRGTRCKAHGKTSAGSAV
ncbi:MAG: hypothetical protein BGO25_03040 [Acidobacteriales bacterium 59-55]|nr:MAG: hypothetical protein BGO25_03040 [Acidobacteriales bacterium 59-55]